MITESEATQIILERNNFYDMVTEFPKAFLFWRSDGEEMIGGPDTPAAVLKENGEIASMPLFVSTGLCDYDHVISEHKIKKEW